VACYCVHGIESLVSMQGNEFLDRTRDSKFLKECSVP
jgi:hypothetical protein